MGIIIALIVGAIVGWLAASIAGRREGFFGSMAIGVVGAVIGAILSSLVSGTNKSYLSFTWSGIFWSFVGALILAILLNAMQNRGHTRV